jgi:hypothetical protein
VKKRGEEVERSMRREWQGKTHTVALFPIVMLVRHRRGVSEGGEKYAYRKKVRHRVVIEDISLASLLRQGSEKEQACTRAVERGVNFSSSAMSIQQREPERKNPG